MVDAPVEFAERGERGRPHPDDQVLVQVSVVGGVGGVELVDGPLPVAGLRRLRERCEGAGGRRRMRGERGGEGEGEGEGRGRQRGRGGGEGETERGRGDREWEGEWRGRQREGGEGRG